MKGNLIYLSKELTETKNVHIMEEKLKYEEKTIVVKVTVCVGSTCHVKGTNLVVERLKSLIVENDLTEKVSLRGMFCVGNCQKGVSVTVDGVVHSVHPEAVDEFFNQEILPRTKEQG